MEYALPVFLCLFIAQGCILGIIRNVYNYKTVQKYTPYAEADKPVYKNGIPDGLHWEIFLSQKKKGGISPPFSTCRAAARF